MMLAIALAAAAAASCSRRSRSASEKSSPTGGSCSGDDRGPTKIRVLQKSHHTVTGKELTQHACTGTTDARFFGLYADIPGLVYGPISESIHGFDERVSLSSTLRITQAMALFIAEWCGTEKAN